MRTELTLNGGERRPLYIAALVAGYLVVATIGRYVFFSSDPFFTALPAAISLAAVFLVGYDLAIAVLTVAFFWIVYVYHFSFTVSLAIAGATALQAIVGAYLLRDLHFNTGFSRMRDALALIAVAIGTGLILPVIGSLALFMGGYILPEFVRPIVGTWWTREAFALLVFTPFLLRWLPKPFFIRRTRDYIEIAISLAVLITFAVILFWTPYTQVLGFPLIYLLLLPLIWIGLRVGPRIMTLGIFSTATIALFGVRFSHAAPPGSLIDDRFFQIELLFSILSIIFLLLVALAEERKDTTVALARQVERLEIALGQVARESEARSDFLAVLAHELRNPLAPILSSLELMRLSSDASDKVKETVNAMRGRVRTMARLLDDLLDITRVSHQKLALKREPIDLVISGRRSIEATRPMARELKHKLVFREPADPIIIDADPVRIEQIMVNLLANAIKYTNAGGRIELTVTKNENEAVIRVKDNGMGIERAQQARIFEPFRQGSPDRRGAGTGLGIGLALTRDLVEMHGGRISVYSEGTDKGSVFTVTLPPPRDPLEVAALQSERRRQIKLIRPATTSLSIVIVDDNVGAARALGELLEYVGHKITLAHSAKEALDKIKTTTADIAILDIGLPDMSGYDLAKKVKVLRPSMSLIALTGFGTDEDKQRAKESGFDFHLTKPVGLVDLEAVLRQISEET